MLLGDVVPILPTTVQQTNINIHLSVTTQNATSREHLGAWNRVVGRNSAGVHRMFGAEEAGAVGDRLGSV